MSMRLQVLICFLISSLCINYCFSQTTRNSHRENLTASTETEQISVSSDAPEEEFTTDVEVMFNDCVFKVPDAGLSTEEKLQKFPTRRRRRAIVTTNKDLTTDDTPELLSRNGSSHHYSDSFLNCSHIGIQPGEFDFFPNGSIYVPHVSRTYDKSDFCQHTDGTVFICGGSFLDSNASYGTGGRSIAHLSDEFINCTGHIEIDKRDFESRPNRSVYVPLYDRVFDYSNHLIGEEGQLYLCPVFFPKEEKFAKSFEIVTIIGLSVSVVFIALYMIFFAFMESLRNLPGYCLFSLCVALLTAYFCFLLRSMEPSEDQCKDLVYGMMYFFLSAFFWMNVLSFDVWRTLKMATSKLRVSGNSMMWKRFALYSAYAWIFPLSIVVFGAAFTNYGGSVEHLKIEFNAKLCWFKNKGALFVYLALPLLILMCLNMFFFSASFFMIINASMKATGDTAAFWWKRFFLFLRLAVIMGVAWIFGIIAAATNEPVLFYIFVLLNTLQGVFIFFSFALSEKAKKALKKKLKPRKCSIIRTQITSQQVQSTTTL